MVGALRPAAAELPVFDFTYPGIEKEWRHSRDVASMIPNEEGLAVAIRGDDPYIEGPARDYPPGQPLWAHLRIKSETGGSGQIFYYRTTASEADSVHFHVPAGGWRNVRVALPALVPGFKIRIDPPGTKARAILSRLSFEERIAFEQPAWPVPEPPRIGAGAPAIRSGGLELTHGSELGGFVVKLDGESVATGSNRPMAGYVIERRQRWVALGGTASTRVRKEDGAISVEALAKDEDGATWRVQQRFRPAANGAIEVEAGIETDRDRAVVFAPLFLLLPGKGSFGTSKTQALFPGVEYLDKDEPSSSEADIIGPGAKRQAPDATQITFPLMTIAADGRWVGLIWQPTEDAAALFDSPDRIFKSGAHVMGLIMPGASPETRIDGGPMPAFAAKLVAGKPVRIRATIVAGTGPDVIPAVERYVALRGMAPVPDPGVDFQRYIVLAAAGWLDSGIVQGDRYRHAYPGKFQPQRSADAAMMMDWLAACTRDQQLAGRLRQEAQAAIAAAPPADYNSAAIGHVRYPVESLLYGHAAESVASARKRGERLLAQLEPDGSVKYRATGKVDYGKTHFAPDANGLTANIVKELLEAGTVSGDRKLVSAGLRALRALEKFAGTAPRGAQTWEVPLHTPDILASAHLVQAYTLGYEITGELHFLEMARYWAWTGVPFVYLWNPTGQRIGPYATTAVLGATNWVAPNWMGRPVQWCGLVYADALYRLTLYDAAGPWRKVADGIAASGIQQTWPLGQDRSRQGLLPDSVSIATQERFDPAINPGTLQAVAMRLFGQHPAYEFKAARQAGPYVHAPGEIAGWTDAPGRLSFRVHSAIHEEYDVLLSNCDKPSRVTGGKYEYSSEDRSLVLHLRGDAVVELEWPGLAIMRPQKT